MFRKVILAAAAAAIMAGGAGVTATPADARMLKDRGHAAVKIHGWKDKRHHRGWKHRRHHRGGLFGWLRLKRHDRHHRGWHKGRRDERIYKRKRRRLK